MKKFILIIIFILISSRMTLAGEREVKGALTLSGAWAIYPTAVAWAEGFKKLYPQVRVDVSAGGAGKGAADAISGLVDIGMVSREPDPAELKKDLTPVYVLFDAVFPLISEKNPALPELMQKGIKKETWLDIYINGTVTTWDMIAGKKLNRKIHVYTRSDSSGAPASWAAYLGKKQEDLRGVGIYGDPGLIESTRRDPLGIGYANFSFLFSRDGKLLPGIKLVPIDSNENGVADPEEICENRSMAVKSISSGRFPATRKNYFFVKGRPKGLIKEFIRFALSEEGARIVNEVGAGLPVPKEEREKILLSMEEK